MMKFTPVEVSLELMSKDGLTSIIGSLFLGEIKRERWKTNLGGGGEQMILRQTVLDFGFNF